MMRKLVMLALMTVPVCHAAEPLGRLFFTPNERAELDRMRHLPPAIAPKPAVKIVAPKPLAPPLPVSTVVRVNGVVQRSDGASTVWINNQPLADYETQGAASIKQRNTGTVVIALPKSQAVEMKVGQTMNPQSEEIREGYSQSSAPQPNGAVSSEPADSSEQDFSALYSVSSKAQ